MEQITSINITCQGATTVELDELNDLQGNLKDLTDEDYAKLRNSITQFGFSFPIFLWVDPEGKKWIVDAHQRKRVLRKMREEGIIIPPLPADLIYAKDKIEAKEKLLLHESHFGKLTQEGYDEFITDIPMDDISDMLAIDGVMTEENQEEKKEFSPKSQEVKCPACGHEFTA